MPEWLPFMSSMEFVYTLPFASNQGINLTWLQYTRHDSRSVACFDIIHISSRFKINYCAQAYSLVNPSAGGCSQFFPSYSRSSPSMTWNV